MVRATFSGFNTALSALQANQKRLDITGQNLSNMNTAGYTRQQLEASSLNYTNPVSHYSNGNETAVGFGVSMDRVSQILIWISNTAASLLTAAIPIVYRLPLIPCQRYWTKQPFPASVRHLMISSLPLQACRILQRYPIPSMKVSCELKCSLYVIFLTRHPDRSHRPNRMNFKGSQGKAAVNRAMCRRSMTSSARSAT